MYEEEEEEEEEKKKKSKRSCSTTEPLNTTFFLSFQNLFKVTLTNALGFTFNSQQIFHFLLRFIRIFLQNQQKTKMEINEQTYNALQQYLMQTLNPATQKDGKSMFLFIAFHYNKTDTFL